jgi:hypothetical protein
MSCNRTGRRAHKLGPGASGSSRLGLGCHRGRWMRLCIRAAQRDPGTVIVGELICYRRVVQNVGPHDGDFPHCRNGSLVLKMVEGVSGMTGEHAFTIQLVNPKHPRLSARRLSDHPVQQQHRDGGSVHNRGRSGLRHPQTSDAGRDARGRQHLPGDREVSATAVRMTLAAWLTCRPSPRPKRNCSPNRANGLVPRPSEMSC